MCDLVPTEDGYFFCEECGAHVEEPCEYEDDYDDEGE